MGVRVPPGRPAPEGRRTRRSTVEQPPLKRPRGGSTPPESTKTYRSRPTAGRRPLTPLMQVRSLPPVPRAPSGRDRPTLALRAGIGAGELAPPALLSEEGRRGDAGRHARPLLRPERGAGTAAPPCPRLASPRREAGRRRPAGPSGPRICDNREAIWRGRTRAPVCRCSSKVERAPVKRLTVVRSRPPTPFAPIAQRLSSCPVNRRIRFDSGWGLRTARSSRGRMPVFHTERRGSSPLRVTAPRRHAARGSQANLVIAAGRNPAQPGSIPGWPTEEVPSPL